MATICFNNFNKTKNFVLGLEDELNLSQSQRNWFKGLVNEESGNDPEFSGKFMLLLAIVHHCERIGDKL